MSYRALQNSLGVYDRFRLSETANPLSSDNGVDLSYNTYGGRSESNITYATPGLVRQDTEALGITFGGTPPDAGLPYIITDNTTDAGGGPVIYAKNFHSVEVWFNPTGTDDGEADGQGLIFGCRNTSADIDEQFGLSFIRDGLNNTARIDAMWRRNGVSYRVKTTSPVLPFSQKGHILATFDGSGSVKIYLNGTEITDTVTGSGLSSNSDGVISIGSVSGGKCPLGQMDELTFYDNELTAANVSSLYQAGARVHSPATLIAPLIASGLIE